MKGCALVKRPFAIAVLFFALTACGFHLRGAVPLPAWLERAYVTGEPRYDEVVGELKRALRAAGVALVSQPGQGKVVIIVEGEQRQRRILSVDGEGRPREYELSYRLDYSVRTPEGERLLPLQSVVRAREYTFDEAEVLGKSTERDALWRELRRRVVEEVVNRLRYSRPKSQ